MRPARILEGWHGGMRPALPEAGIGLPRWGAEPSPVPLHCRYPPPHGTLSGGQRLIGTTRDLPDSLGTLPNEGRGLEGEATIRPDERGGGAHVSLATPREPLSVRSEPMSIQSGGRQLAIHGLALVLAGLLVGFIPPSTPYPRLALGAHIQFVTHGMLFMVLAMVVLVVPHKAGPRTLGVMVASAWLTWCMSVSAVANAWWGTHQLLPIAAKQAGASGGVPWQEVVVKLGHMPAALGLILSVTLLLIGVARHRGAGTAGRTE